MKRYNDNTSFLDLLFNFLLATTILLVIAVLHIVVENNKADIKSEAEYVITLTWDRTKDIDVDIWVKDPSGNLLWYRQKEISIMHLDRDDKGHLGQDWTTDKFGEIHYNPNQEIVTIRGIQSGEWIINLHMFRTLSFALLPVDVDISLIKLNPKATTVFQKKVVLSKYWEQKTIARVTISDDGSILQVDDGPSADLIQNRVRAGHNSRLPPLGEVSEGDTPGP
jgi:hypothetical protein